MIETGIAIELVKAEDFGFVTRETIGGSIALSKQTSAKRNGEVNSIGNGSIG